VDAKLDQIMELREIGDFDRARPLLYDVLTEGDESQVEVAKGILAQLDA
jgi:FimV-like protein